MKKIGAGWQVSVYEHNPTTVYKQPHTGTRAYTSIIKGNPMLLLTPWKLRGWVKNLKRAQRVSFASLIRRSDLAEHLANPVFEISGAYYQDKVIPIHDYIQGISEDQFKSLVQKFADFTYFLYEHGFVDKSFNFLKNFGVVDDRIILIDLGELYFDPKQVEQQIKSRAWARPYILLEFPKAYRTFYINTMDERFEKNKRKTH